MVWISIEGSIGSGKTTVIERLNKDYSTNNIKVYKEPVYDWKTCLDLFYSNQSRNAFLMQIRVNTSFIEIYNNINKFKTVITERSSYSSKYVFGKMLNDQGIMNNIEYELSNKLVEITQQKIPDYFIYLRTNPEVCYNRIIGRGDKPIDIDYLNNLNYYHDCVFYNKHNTYTIDTTNFSKDQTFDYVLYILRLINLK